MKIPHWLPAKKQAAVCFSIDDIHPSKSSDAYEAGGDLSGGSLGLVEWLLERHPELRVTLFVTADWRETSPIITRRMLAKVPGLRDAVYLTEILPKGTMQLDRHPEFVRYLKDLPRTDIALHGLHHVHKGRAITREFFELDRAACEKKLSEMLAIFDAAELPYSAGMCPPSWEFSEALGDAMIAHGLKFVATSRDILTPVSTDAVNAMSGRKGTSLIYPELVCDDRLLHFTSNFQATSLMERAFQILDHGGLLAVKAHIIKNCCGHIALDGIDQLYCNYLDALFTEIENRYGDAVWWTSMNEITAFVNQQPGGVATVGVDRYAACN